MKKKILATVGAASFALSLSTTASHALLGYWPGENMGLATGAPLPEGLFGIDDEYYGKRDGTTGYLGLNIPELVWSTPVSFYNTRLELAYAAPFFHSNGFTATGLPGGAATPLTDGRTRFFNQGFGVLLAHDFGGGWGGSVWGLIRPADQAFIPHSYADLRTAISYTANGFDITAQFGYTGTFGSKNSIGTGANPGIPGYPGGSLPGIADAVNVDFTATKKFDKFEIGFVGYAHTDIEDGLDNANAVGYTGKPAGVGGFTRAGAVAVGGLIGYDFGKFTLQGMATREVASRGAPELFTGTGKETRGWLRLIVPLYVAPAAPAPVVAKY